MLPIHKESSKLNINKTQMDFDATSLYPSAMWDKNSVYPVIETGHIFKHLINNMFVKNFNKLTFNQDGNVSVFLKKVIYQILHFNNE